MNIRNTLLLSGLLALGVACKAREGHPSGMVWLRGGLGTSDITTVPTAAPEVTVDADSSFGEFAFERSGIVGGGLRFGAYQSDDYAENNPLLETTLTGVQFFPHLTIQPAGGPFRMPIRIGPEVRAHTISSEANLGDTDTDFAYFGGGIELEPEVDFFRNDTAALSIYGKVHGGAGTAAIETTTNSNDTDWDTSGVTLDVEAGLRFQIAKFLLQGGYVRKSTTYDTSDPSDGFPSSIFPETELSFEGFFFSIGVRW